MFFDSVELLEEEELEKELCERSLLEFMRVFWPVIDGSQFRSGRHLEAICDHLEAVNRNEIRNLGIQGPPRSSKSMPASVFFQPWDWINKPYRSWLTAGNTQRLAVGFNYQSRMIIRSEKFRRYWGDRFKLSLDNDLKTEFSNDQGGKRLVVGIKTKFIGAGGERKVIDDPHMPDDSPAAMLETGEWFFGTWRSRTNNPRTASELIIMQRLSIYDLIEQIKVNEPSAWEFLTLPSRFDPARRYWTSIGWTDHRTKEGELLWPEHVGEEEENTLRRSLKHRADAQMDQNPVSSDDALYKPEYLRNYFSEIIYDRDTDVVISTTDTGVKSNSTADFTASAIILKKGNRKFHIAGFAKKMEIGDLLKTYQSMLSQWRTRGLRFYRHLIEDAANGPALAGLSSKKFPRIELVKAFKNKLIRLKAVVPEYETNAVWYPRAGATIEIDGVKYPLNTGDEEFVTEWLKQTRAVPSSEKDDCPDATAQGLTYLEDISFLDIEGDDDDDISKYIYMP